MKKLLLALAIITGLLGPAMAASTIDPTQPRQSTPQNPSPLTSTPVRNNFLAAYNDINNILGVFAATTAPSNPVDLQSWADKSTLPIVTFRYYNKTNNVWVPYATLNVNTNAYSTFATSGAFLANPPLTVSVVGGIATYGLAIDSNFAVVSNQLALASAPNARMLATCTGSSGEMLPCTWGNFAAQAIGSTNGIFPHYVGGAWTTDTTGTTGHSVPFLDGANSWSASQNLYPGASAQQATQTGALWRIANLDTVASNYEADSYGASAGAVCVRAGGTNAVRLTLSANDEICHLSAHGYDGTAFTTASAALRLYASQTWTVGAHGSYARISATPNGSTTAADVVGFENNGGITVPPTVTGGNMGPGTINAAGLYVNGVSSTVSSGTINQLAWYAASGTAISGLATANNGVLVTSGTGVPSISSILPSNISIGQSLSLGGTSLVVANNAASAVFAIGQDSTHYFTANWVFNATPALANAQIATASFANPMTIDASSISIQGLSGGTLSLLGRTVALGGNLSTAAALTQAGAFATTITATATTNSTLPAGTHTLAGLDIAETWSANQSFNSGNLLLNGATSGASTLNAPATGGGTATLFTGTDTIAGVASTQTLTGKSLLATSNIIGGVTMTLGSDGTGDIYYRSAGGVLTRLGIGSSTNILTVSGGLPSWSAAPAAGLTVGTTAIASGTTTRILFDNAGVLGEYTLTGTGTTVAMSAGPTFTGTVTAPTIAGGSGAASNHIIQSTSGAGTTDFIAFQTASQLERMRILTSGFVGIGTNNPQNILHVNANTVQNVPKLIAGIQLSLADTVTGGIQIDSFGAANPQFTLRTANGTAASKTATGSGNFLFILDGEGYNGSAYAGTGLIGFQAAENWTGSAEGTFGVIHTTPIGSIARAEAARFQPSGGLSVCSACATDPGIGSILSQTHATSNPATLTGTSGTVSATQSSIIFNPSGTFTVTLPSAASFPGRWLWLKSIAAQIVNSASSNVVPSSTATAGTAIFTASAGKWAGLQSDGTNWITMYSN